ncbi:MAG: hypothetical protein Q8S54_11680 [Bacteroidota bacterium]|nr:hypothetical protein [Bacteroidota bacterium]
MAKKKATGKSKKNLLQRDLGQQKETTFRSDRERIDLQRKLTHSENTKDLPTI